MHSKHTGKYEGEFQEDSYKRKYNNANICLDWPSLGDYVPFNHTPDDLS